MFDFGRCVIDESKSSFFLYFYSNLNQKNVVSYTM